MVMRTLSESVPATATSARARSMPARRKVASAVASPSRGCAPAARARHQRGVPAIDHHDGHAAAEEIRADVLADVAVAADDDVLLERVDSLSHAPLPPEVTQLAGDDAC